jgi:hypothetical protein
LTQAIALNEDTGKLHPKFEKWSLVSKIGFSLTYDDV